MHEDLIGSKPGPDVGRDAVHVALAPLEAAEALLPGERCGLGGGRDRKEGPGVPALGIVDPFLCSRVEPGERFFLFLFPGTVQGMRHAWEHPAFGPESAATAAGADVSQAWLEALAVGLNSYDDRDTAIDRLRQGLRTGHIETHGSEVQNRHDFRDVLERHGGGVDDLRRHAQAAWGIDLPEEFLAPEDDNTVFRCSC